MQQQSGGFQTTSRCACATSQTVDCRRFGIPNTEPTCTTSITTTSLPDTTLQPEECRVSNTGARRMSGRTSRGTTTARGLHAARGLLEPRADHLGDLRLVVQHRRTTGPMRRTRPISWKSLEFTTMIAGYGMLEAGLTIQSVKARGRGFRPTSTTVDGMMKGRSAASAVWTCWVPSTY